jgi:glutamate synthase (NADPH/NADH) small chain
MGKTTGFMEYPRQNPPDRPVEERVGNFREFHLHLPDDKLQTQAARCMDCGVPFCHSACPLGNLIPEWNDLVYRGRWKEAARRLLSTNSFPEFTGRVCPAPCEGSCVLGINNDPVTIKEIEVQIVEHAFAQGWIKPQPPVVRTGKNVAVVGSGPAGLAAAAQLNRAGHSVTVFERADRVGGILMYGIPDYKLEKRIVQRRVDLMAAEGVVFKSGVRVGIDLPASELKAQFDAVCLAGGSTVPRDLSVPGRDLAGIRFAMEFLPQQNRRNWGDKLDPAAEILATGKKVVILGGGDTGADCLGTSIRQGALSIHQFEILPEPPPMRAPANPWPQWPNVLRLSSSHEEGGVREFCVSTKSFEGEGGRVKKINAIRVEWIKGESGRLEMKEIPGTGFTVDADLVLLAMGFLHPEAGALLKDLGVELDPRGNVKVGPDKQTNVPGVFAAGDAERGQSLVVWAIAGGRAAARGIDRALMGETALA